MLLNTRPRSYILLEKGSWKDSDQKDRTGEGKAEGPAPWTLVLGNLPLSSSQDGERRPGPHRPGARALRGKLNSPWLSRPRI